MLMCNGLISDCLGKDSLTLFGVCLQLQSFTFAFTVGVCIAGISLISYLRSDGDHEAVLHILDKALQHVTIFYVILAILMAAVPRLFLMIFELDHEPINLMARTPFICYAIYYLCFCILSVYVTLSFQLSGRVGAKILFVFGICISSYVAMRLFSLASPEMLWYGLAVGSFPVLVLSICYGYRLHKRNPLLSRFTVSSTFPEYIQVDFSLNQAFAENSEFVKAINLFTDTCEMPGRTKQDIMDTINKLTSAIVERHGKSERTYDVFIKEREDNFELIVKDDGSPFDPSMNIGDSDIQRNIRYRFIFGMNITSVTWSK